jgi:hypothetical protein
MPKIKCPHCGANNQDVTEKDRCWQCEVVLGAPPAPTDLAEPTPTAPTPSQKQVESQTPTPRPAASPPQSRFPVAPHALGVGVLLIVLAVVLFLMKK